MTISANVQKQFFRTVSSANSDDLIRIPPTVIMSHNLPQETPRAPFIKSRRRLNIWTVEEHELFLRGLELHPRGPWKAIAAVVGTKTTRQTMTHAQKYRQKIRRMEAGQTIKILRVPSHSDNDDSGEVEEELHNQDDCSIDTLVHEMDLDVPGMSQAVGEEVAAMMVADESFSESIFQDWEMDALLAELSQSLDIQMEDIGANEH